MSKIRPQNCLKIATCALVAVLLEQQLFDVGNCNFNSLSPLGLSFNVRPPVPTGHRPSPLSPYWRQVLAHQSLQETSTRHSVSTGHRSSPPQSIQDTGPHPLSPYWRQVLAPQSLLEKKYSPLSPYWRQVLAPQSLQST